MKTCPLDLVECAMPECLGGICARTGDDTFTACWECGFVHVGWLVVGACVRCHPRAEPAVGRASGRN